MDDCWSSACGHGQQQIGSSSTFNLNQQDGSMHMQDQSSFHKQDQDIARYVLQWNSHHHRQAIFTFWLVTVHYSNRLKNEYIRVHFAIEINWFKS